MAKPFNGGISHSELLKLLHYDAKTGIFTWLIDKGSAKTGFVAGTSQRGYRHIKIGQRKYKACRLAWFYMTNSWPSDQIDHINRIRDDDRWVNLREATQSLNNRNCISRNKTGFKGVQPLPSGRFGSLIRPGAGQKLVYLGSFDSPEEAHQAYLVEARKLAGDFASS